jgi:hypothetical protein
MVAAVCGLLVAPLAWHLLRLPIVNPAPIEYTSKLLRRPEYALQSHTWLIFPLTVIGIISACRRLSGPAGVILGYGLVGLLGQSLGYARLLTGWPLPALVPHEFQWHTQIAVGLLAACGTLRVAQWAAGLIERHWPRARVSCVLLMIPLVAAVVQGETGAAVRHRKSDHWRSTSLSQSHAGAVAWIKERTSIHDVFLASGGMNYTLVAGHTGRKIVCPPEGHANIAIPVQRLAAARRQMFQTSSARQLRDLLDAHSVRYVLLTADALAFWDRWRASGLFERVYGARLRSLTILHVRAGAS